MYIHVYVYLRVEVVVVVAAHIYVVASGVYLSSFFLLSPSFDVVSGALNGLLTRVVKDTQAHARLDADKMYAICLPRSTVCVCVCVCVYIYIYMSRVRSIVFSIESRASSFFFLPFSRCSLSRLLYTTRGECVENNCVSDIRVELSIGNWSL